MASGLNNSAGRTPFESAATALTCHVSDTGQLMLPRQLDNAARKYSACEQAPVLDISVTHTPDQVYQIMGWKLNLELRCNLLAPAITYASTLDEASGPVPVHRPIVLIDGPAAFRSAAVGTRPPSAVVESVLEHAWRGADIAVFFDCPLLVPDERATVHLARATKTDAQIPYDEHVLEGVVAGRLGTATWQGLFSTRRGKAAAYAALSAAVRTYARRTHCNHGIGERRVTVTDPRTAAVWGHPFDKPSEFAELLNKHPYGEAEAQLAMPSGPYPLGRFSLSQ